MLIWILCLYFMSGSVFGAAPTFSGTYPYTKDTNEGPATPSGTVLHTFTATDSDGVNPMMSYTFDPTDGTYKFTLTETNPSSGTTEVAVALSAGHTLDFETQSVYKIYANAFDGVEYAPAQVLLTINVGDVGETPTLVPPITTQSFVMNETAAGYHVGNPSYSVSDGDNAESFTWSITGGTGSSYLNVISTNGSVYVKSNYDLENGAPTSCYVDVSVTDRYGLSVTLTYSVLVYDINDNMPIFNPVVYNVNVNMSTAVSTELTTFTVTDSDLTVTNNVYNYSLENTAVADYFMVQNDKLILQYTFDIANGNGPYSFKVYATDNGSPQLTGTATVSLTITPELGTTQSTSTAVTAGYDYGSDSSTAALTILACFVAACIFGYLMVLCWRWNTFGQCLPRSCPDNKDCRLACDQCCTCCHGDEDEQIIVNDDDFPTPFVVGEKKGPLGFEEALNKDNAKY